MPIKAENLAKYPANWADIRARIQKRAGDRCEECGVPNHSLRGATVIVCTTAHLDHDPSHNDDENLRFLCQRDHLAYDQEHHLQTAYQTRRAGKAVDMFDEVSA